MNVEGGCYCGALRYAIEGDPLVKGQCHCRECQYTSGGGPNYFLGMPEAGFAYTKGSPARFRRADLDSPVTREFCGTCGTPILTRNPSFPGLVIVKVGSLDDPAVFRAPRLAIHTADKAPFHTLPDGLPAFPRLPG